MNFNFPFSAIPKWTKQSSLSCIVMLWELINNHWHFFSAQIVKWLFTFNSFLLQLSSSFKLLTPFLMSTWRFQLKLKPKYSSTRYQIIENHTWWVFWWLLNTFLRNEITYYVCIIIRIRFWVYVSVYKYCKKWNAS